MEPNGKPPKTWKCPFSFLTSRSVWLRGSSSVEEREGEGSWRVGARNKQTGRDRNRQRDKKTTWMFLTRLLVGILRSLAKLVRIIMITIRISTAPFPKTALSSKNALSPHKPNVLLCNGLIYPIYCGRRIKEQEAG